MHDVVLYDGHILCTRIYNHVYISPKAGVEEMCMHVNS